MFQVSVVLTFLEESSRFTHQCHQRTFPSLVGHHVVAAQLSVQQVVHPDGSPLCIFGFEEGVDLVCDVPSCQLRDPLVLCGSSDTLILLLNSVFMIPRDPLQLENRRCRNSLEHTRTRILRQPNFASKPPCRCLTVEPALTSLRDHVCQVYDSYILNPHVSFCG